MHPAAALRARRIVYDPFSAILGPTLTSGSLGSAAWTRRRFSGVLAAQASALASRGSSRGSVKARQRAWSA